MGVKENIIRLRKLTGVTQEELGKIAGVSRSAVSLWEIGDSEPRMGSVQSIADYVHILHFICAWMISLRSYISSVLFAHFMHPVQLVPSHLGRGRDEKSRPHAWGRLAARPKPSRPGLHLGDTFTGRVTPLNSLRSALRAQAAARGSILTQKSPAPTKGTGPRLLEPYSNLTRTLLALTAPRLLPAEPQQAVGAFHLVVDGRLGGSLRSVHHAHALAALGAGAPYLQNHCTTTSAVASSLAMSITIAHSAAVANAAPMSSASRPHICRSSRSRRGRS